VEAESRVAPFIARRLREQMYAVDVAPDAEQAVYLASVNQYDVIRDHGRPDAARQGRLRSLPRIRAAGFRRPILMLTARDAVDGRVVGLDSRANDDLTKPFDFKELLGRLRALLRRPTDVRPPVARVADLSLDTANHAVQRAGKPVTLIAKGYALLQYLVLNEGQVVGREQIAQHVRNEESDPFTSVIDVYVKRLPAKLDNGQEPRLIHTRRGEGYILAAEPATSDD
jgi:two-component system copper resistance phosphate regulon response regulator CusR